MEFYLRPNRVGLASSDFKDVNMSEVISITRNIELENQTQKGSFEFINSFGCVFKDGFVIHQYNPSVPIQYDSVRKIFVKKRKIIFWNLLFVLAGVLLCCLFFTLDFNLIQMISLSVISAFFLISAFVFSINQYKLIIVNKSLGFSEIIVKNHLKNDAKVLVKKINKKIKK